MSITEQLSTLHKYQEEHLLSEYSNFPRGKYVSLLVLRKTEGETIFRTEGSGEGLSKELVMMGVQQKKPLLRVVISKRKQTAVERRTGRELLREQGMLKPAPTKKGGEVHPCALNTNAPCGKCIDCLLYGYAVGGGGAQKSRVMTDDAYSLAPASQVTAKRTFNATFDNGTMRSPLDGKPSTSIQEDEYVRPETHFLDIETLKDVTLGELQYVIGNILRSSRYGAISSRMGRMRNILVGVIFSDTEIFSNLELTQQVYDLLAPNEGELAFPLDDEVVSHAVHDATNILLQRVVGRLPLVLDNQIVKQIINETVALYREPERVKALLQEIEEGYKTVVG